MHPAFSVIFLTTLIGVGQGLFLALFTEQSYSAIGLLPAQENGFYVTGSVIALLFLVGGLFAAVFHLGKPSYMITRAWRGMLQWRTSWLSRELIAMPAAMGMVFFYGLFHYAGWDADLFGVPELKGQLSLVVGILTTVVILALFICTAMIYASVRFLQEWACALTVVNYLVLGTASGFTLAAAYAAYSAPELVGFYSGWAIAITIVGLLTRGASLYRNARIKYKSTIQSATGIRHAKVVQKSMGMMGGSFNTREFFHGKSAGFLKSVKYIFLMLAFIVPVLLLWSAGEDSQGTLMMAFVIQYVGLLFERWFFFAQANHPQNIYYQTI